MPVTYSINVGTNLEAYRKSDIISVLKDIPDNTHKLISPKDIRDAFLSTWANSPIKQTKNTSGIEYIGIDSGNPADRDIKQKILLGKRSYANLDIMTDSLLGNTRADIYIYNTKPDSYLTQSSTKVAILAGTNSLLYQNAPYIESKIVGTTNHFEFRNPSLLNGPISIYSSTGRVAINGILFPTVSENVSNAGNGKVLKYSGSYPNGYLKWSEITFNETNVGALGLPTNIYGSPVKLNGHSLEFVDSSVVPNPIGGVPAGFSFSSNSYNSPITSTQQNWPLSEVLRKVLYPYVAPTLSLSVVDNATGSTYAVAGSSITANLTYLLTIYPRTPDEYVSNCYILTQKITTGSIGLTESSVPAYNGLSFSGVPGKTFSTSIPFLISDPGNGVGGTYKYTMAYSNVPGTGIAGYPLAGLGSYNSGWSYSTTAEIKFIKPIYSGFSGTSSKVSFIPGIAYTTGGSTNLNTFTTTKLNPLLSDTRVPKLTKLVKPYPGINSSLTLSVTGTGRLYFIYPRANGIGDTLHESNLLSIKDPNGFVLYQKGSPTASAFYPGTFDMVNQRGGGDYVVWESKMPCSYQGDGFFVLTFGTASPTTGTNAFRWPYAPPVVSNDPIIDDGGYN
jgi:hypothetical protein